MISFISQLSGEKIVLEKGKLLGEGNYGKVYNLTREGSETHLVCKEIHLHHPKDKGFWSDRHEYMRSYRLWVAKNEIERLHGLGLLVGYESKVGVFYIIMKRVDGTPMSLALERASNNKEVFYQAFKALKRMHRLGFAHGDPHPANLMVSNGLPSTVSLLDFGQTNSASFLGSVADYKIFWPYAPQNCSFMRFYMREMLEHFQKNKIAVSAELIAFALLGFAAKYGIPSLSIEPERIGTFLVSCALQKLGDSCEFARHMPVLPLMVMSLAPRSLGVAYNCKAGPLSLIKGTNRLFDPVACLNTAYLYTSASKVTGAISGILDDYILPECVIKKKTDLLFKYVYPTSSRLLSKAKKRVYGDTPGKAKTTLGFAP